MAVLLLSGCAAMQAYRGERARWQALADQVTAHFGVEPVQVTLVNGSRGVYNCATQALDLATDGNTRWLLAHELGHHLSRFCGGTVESEMVANTWAVEVLRVWGDTEAEAVRATVSHLVYLKYLRGDRQFAGHNYCAEAADVLRQYPGHPDPRAPGDATCRAELLQSTQ